MSADLVVYCRYCGRKMIPLYDKKLFDGATGEKINPKVIGYYCPRYSRDGECHDSFVDGRFDSFDRTSDGY